MAGFSPKQGMRREIFALVLCLLAMLFALEAKIAWYLPPHTAGSEMQAAKALPADTPQEIPHGLPGQPPLFFLLCISILCAVTNVCTRKTLLFCDGRVNDRSPSSSSVFSPDRFFRPPPVQ